MPFSAAIPVVLKIRKFEKSSVNTWKKNANFKRHGRENSKTSHTLVLTCSLAMAASQRQLVGRETGTGGGAVETRVIVAVEAESLLGTARGKE